MPLLASDSVGAIAAIFLAIPPLRDQLGRFRERQHDKQRSLTGIHHLLRDSLRRKRDQFSGYDTLLLAIGSSGLVIAFVLKIVGR